MEASIKEPHIKNFVRLLQCASKFGDDLNMHAHGHVVSLNNLDYQNQLSGSCMFQQLELAVTNSTKSAFCLFKLKDFEGRSGFFCRWKMLGTSVQQRKGVKCQLLVKSLLAVLGKASSINAVDRLDLKIIDPGQFLRSKRRKDEEDGDNEEEMGSDEDMERGREAVLVMKLVCKHGVTKKHSLHLGASEFLRAEVDPNTTPSGFTISARALRDMLDHFSIALSGSSYLGGTNIRNDNQLGWMFARSQVRIKSWEAGAKDLQTEITLHPGEFETYEIVRDRVDLMLPMKEFKASLSLSLDGSANGDQAALTLAEQIGVALDVDFSEATQPLTLMGSKTEMKEAHFEIFCAIATTICELFSDIRLSVSSTETKPTRTPTSVNTSQSNLTRAQSREPSVPGGADRGAEATTSARSRNGSERPSSGKRTRLSFNPQDMPQSTQRASVVTNSVQEITSNERATSQSVRHEQLFFPGGSQQGLASQNMDGDRDEEEDLPRPSQRTRMTQQDILRMSGIGNEDLRRAVDEADFEDEEDELRFSQAPPQARTSQGKIESHASQQGENSLFLPDESVFDNDITNVADMRARVRDEQDEEDELDEDEAIEPTQAAASSSRSHPNMFND